jgi:hypothetical protein
MSSPPHPDRLWGPSYPMGNGSLSMEVRRPRPEANHSPPSSAEVKNAWRYTSTDFSICRSAHVLNSPCGSPNHSISYLRHVFFHMPAKSNEPVTFPCPSHNYCIYLAPYSKLKRVSHTVCYCVISSYSLSLTSAICRSILFWNTLHLYYFIGIKDNKTYWLTDWLTN